MSTKSTRVCALDVARYFINRSQRENCPVTNKKLQKLVYYAQAWSLVLNNEKLFSEKIQAWVHGPAIPSLYHVFKNFQANPIVLEQTIEPSSFTKKQEVVLEAVWKTYGRLDAAYLEMLTHSEKPWLDARKGLQSHESSTNEITPASMRSFYSIKMKTASNNR